MSGARSVESNQETIHKDLEKLVRRYAQTQYLRPIASHTREAFLLAEKALEDWAKKNGNAEAPVVIDSGCGTGESTIHLARRFKDCFVIGVDKSAMRLNKAGNAAQLDSEPVPSNAYWVRAELLDFWRLAQEARWNIQYHAVFYPNPWPKQSECTRRFHMHPIFPTMMSLAPVTELRTNWEIYAKEFAAAAELLASEQETAKGLHADCTVFVPASPETAFERKYAAAGQPLWRVIVKR